jgi:penicillin-binding protein 1B
LLWLAFELFIWGSLVAVVAGGFYAFSVDQELTAKFEGKRWKLPSQVYSDTLTITPEMKLTTSGVVDRLKRLNYHEVTEEPKQAGEYRAQATALEIFQRRFDYPGEMVKPRLVRVTLNGDRVGKLLDVTERKDLTMLDIEPELIGRFFGQVQEVRRIIPWADIPKSLVWSVVAVEDAGFFHHHGINVRGVLRATLKAAIHLKAREGGSSITQQLVKNFYLTPERTVLRKLKEMVMAVVLEMHYPKEKIFEVYINEIYFGQQGSVSICGLGEAAEFYFAKRAEDLTLAESALLAGLIRSPLGYDPRKHEERAKIRRDYILTRLADMPEALRELKVDQAALRAAAKQELAVHRRLPPRTIAPYFIDLLRQQLARTYGEDVLQSEGLRVFTTLDVPTQKRAEAAVTEGLADLEKNNANLRGGGENRLQAALIVIEPGTGYVRAMVGGRDYASSSYNRAVQMRRQTGSVFKPFVYTAGFLRAHEDRSFSFTGATIVEDKSFSVMSGGRPWTPQNYDHIFEGRITVRHALEHSRNVPTARLAMQIGLDRIVSTARAMGVTADLPQYPSLSLGIAEMSPLEVASAYSVLANQGYYNEPLTFRDVVDRAGNVLEKRSVRTRRALPAEVAFLTTSLLQGVIDRGTAAAARSRGFTLPAAGKTGTTSSEYDAWFAGYTPSLLAVTWVGFDRERNVGLTGASAALPLWVKFMIEQTRGQAAETFEPPPGIVFRKICQDSGLLSRYNCPHVVEEAFEDGREPTEECNVHRDGLLEFFRKKAR